MSELISVYFNPNKINKCLTDTEKDGKKLYKQNETYKLLANCLENPDFQKLFNNHFDTLDNLKVILMFMKLYNQIGKNYPIELNGYQKLSIMDKLMKDKDFRRKICHQVSNIMKVETSSKLFKKVNYLQTYHPHNQTKNTL